ncbi:hypothetical protein [Photobacterium kishitanii]|uniref:hypothetical protein n=1 Tax=Photobacterium kishitanii TaxID=318456 RepID=UPI00071AEDAC|nr:hypothetical protein [Photobacterium kishitanii]
MKQSAIYITQRTNKAFHSALAKTGNLSLASIVNSQLNSSLQRKQNNIRTQDGGLFQITSHKKVHKLREYNPYNRPKNFKYTELSIASMVKTRALNKEKQFLVTKKRLESFNVTTSKENGYFAIKQKIESYNITERNRL